MLPSKLSRALFLIINILMCPAKENATLDDVNDEIIAEPMLDYGNDEMENNDGDDINYDLENIPEVDENDENIRLEHVMEGKVVGGSYANIGDYPHAVFLRAYCDVENADLNWSCGSSILNQRILLTAGHCVEGCIRNFKIDAYAGDQNYEHSNMLRQVRRYILHASYNKVTVFADIALLFLNRDLTLGKNLKRLIISPSFPNAADCHMAGWGAVNEEQTPTIKLKVVAQKVWSVSHCAKHEHLMRGTFCASSGYRYHYPYSGDSGSALVTKDKQQVGLVSFRDDSKPELIIYTNVSYYYKWIHDKSMRLFCYST